MSLRRILGLAAVILPCVFAGAAEADPGAVVESVTPGSVGEKAGLQPGDLILAAPGGRIDSPYDLVSLEFEEAPRRSVILRGKRGDQEMAWTLTAAEWGIEVRPGLPAGLAALYAEGGERLAAGDLAAVERAWRSAADEARNTGDGRLAAWFLDRLARRLAEAGKQAEADGAFGDALALLQRETDHPAATRLLRNWGNALAGRADWDAAVERFQQALALDRQTAAVSLAEARTLNDLGVTAAKRGDYAAAEELLRQALEIREALAPGTSEVTGSLNNLGILARVSGDLAAAEKYLTKGEELLRRLYPNSSDHALILQNLGTLAQVRGGLNEAERFFRQALAMFERIAPGGPGVIGCLSSLASVTMVWGDLLAAENLLRRALALQEAQAPDELDLSKNLVRLGNLTSRRGDLEAAEDYYRRALAIQEKLSPEGKEAAGSLGNLGSLAILRGDFATARTFLQRALAIEEKLAPGTLDAAADLEQLGRLEMASGNLTRAEELFRRALEIYEKEAPASLGTSEILRDLGEVAARRGRFQDARALHRRALDLQSRLAPGTTGEAESLYFLGRSELRAGQPEEGTRRLCRAIDVLDRQRGRIGGTQEVRASFEATLGDYYQACLEGLIELGRPAEAFFTLERGRARSFLALLAERDVRLADLPPELDAERLQTNAEYDRIQSQLTRLSFGRDDAEIERLVGALRDLRSRQEEILTRIRRASPRSAALEAPEPLDLAGARAALDPGTVLLEYAVGPERAWLFVLQSPDAASPGLSVVPIAIGAKALREEVESFRRLLTSPESDRGMIGERARRLYGLLVQPAEAQIAQARRILVSPDGPLHTLPFAALRRQARWLVEWKPVHLVLSATVYGELTRARPVRPNPGEERLAAFGNPLYLRSAADAPADPEVREAVRRGWSLASLPSTRDEVEGIAALYPLAQVYLGRDATEERAKSIGKDARYLHFACHGLIDARFPLNSALALTLPENSGEGQDNGLLQAWEIFESVRLDADLVTLSACDTALGQEMGGEGLLGLTRAFQYAGAHSVLASLWGVSDVSTADLMKRFYGYLRAGQSKDEALRAAQIDLIRGKRSAHPFHWAAFQLTGDWR